MLPRSINRRIGKAMHVYNMLGDGDRVLLAVSGGVDSFVLARILQSWLHKAPISYQLHAIHVDMEPGPDGAGQAAKSVQAQLRKIGIDCTIVPTAWQPLEISGERAEPANADTKENLTAWYTVEKKNLEKHLKGTERKKFISQYTQTLDSAPSKHVMEDDTPPF